MKRNFRLKAVELSGESSSPDSPENTLRLCDLCASSESLSFEGERVVKSYDFVLFVVTGEVSAEVKVEMIEKALSEGRNTLSEYESKQLLAAYVIPVTREIEIADREALEEAVKEIGFPLVLKGCGSRLIHKTERNLVRIDVRSRVEALSAFDGIMNEVAQEGGKVLVQEMVRGPRELVAGLNRDIQFGPCVMFGLGGIFTEILKDVSFRVAPLQREDALQMMQEIKARKILGEVRGLPPADLEALARILITLGRIGMEEEKVLEIDINPLILAGSQPVAVDALVVLRGEG